MRILHTLVSTWLLSGSLAMSGQAASSTLDFRSTNRSLEQSFYWAKGQALAYVRPGSAAIGPWYEAALPGRNAFCMRDVSHQTEGAAALGLYAANRNMLGLFAQSSAKSRDWAAYWEIDGEGRPSTADYRSDNDFWFNLPANFDVLDGAVRMWRWTGDDSYRNDPAFEHFFGTLDDYIRTWQLEPDAILKRPRIANRRQAEGTFVDSRGIPSYTEESKDFIFGTDLLASEYRGIRSLQEIATPGDEKKLAVKLGPAADAIQNLLERVGWSKSQHHYLGTIHSDLSGSGSGDALVLYFGAAKDPAHIEGALDYLSSPGYWKDVNIEAESYIPLVLFRYGRSDAGYSVLADISAPQKSRREYPEVSYAVIAAIVDGVMGLEPGHRGDEFGVSTLSRLAEGDNATLAGVSIRQNKIDVTHTGRASTSLKNASGPALLWRAAFAGTVASLRVEGKTVGASHSTLPGGTAISWTMVDVPAGATVTVNR